MVMNTLLVENVEAVAERSYRVHRGRGQEGTSSFNELDFNLSHTMLSETEERGYEHVTDFLVALVIAWLKKSDWLDEHSSRDFLDRASYTSATAHFLAQRQREVQQMTAHRQLQIIKEKFCSEVSDLEDVVAIAFDEPSSKPECLVFWVVMRDWDFDAQRRTHAVRRDIESQHEGIAIDLMFIPLKNRSLSHVMPTQVEPLFSRP